MSQEELQFASISQETFPRAPPDASCLASSALSGTELESKTSINLR